MSLRITKATDHIEVTTLVACIYAIPGIGKSTLGFRAEKPLLLDFDGGAHRAGGRQDCVRVEHWSDVTRISADDLQPYKTIIVDTAGRALDALTSDIIAENPKMGNGGALSLQGYGVLKSRFIAWTKLIRSFGLDVVLICHADEQRKGDEIITRLDVQGGSKNEIYKCSDVMGQIYWDHGKRVLSFDPTDTAFGKNPGRLPPLVVPHFGEAPTFLGDTLAQIKAELNKQSAAQQEVSGQLAEWKEVIDKAETAKQFNDLIPLTQGVDARLRDNVKRLLTKAAKARGLSFDKKAGVFSPVAKAAA